MGDSVSYTSDPSVYSFEGAELITSPPPPDSPLAYREDDIVSIFNDIFRIFLDLCYIGPSDIVFPDEDTGRHRIDTERFRTELNMSPRAVSLVQRLPCIVKDSYDGTQIYQQAIAVNYLNDRDLVPSRDPGKISFISGVNPNFKDVVIFLRPDDIALSFPWNGDCSTLILDLEANTIRFLYDICELPAVPYGYQLEVPEFRDHYRNHPGYHAPSVLKRYCDDLRSLRWFPNRNTESISPTEITDITECIAAKVLQKHYGWPHDFRAAAWAAEYPQVLKDAETEYWRHDDEQTDRRRDMGYLADILMYTEERRDRVVEEIIAKLRQGTTARDTQV